MFKGGSSVIYACERVDALQLEGKGMGQGKGAVSDRAERERELLLKRIRGVT